MRPHTDVAAMRTTDERLSSARATAIANDRPRATAAHFRTHIPGSPQVLAAGPAQTPNGDEARNRRCRWRSTPRSPPAPACPGRLRRTPRQARLEGIIAGHSRDRGTISAMACIGDRAGPARHAGTGPPPAAAAGPAVIDYPALRGYACSCICKFGVSRARAVPVADGFLNGTGHKLPHSYPNHQTCNFHC
jgi:hypothetical protein